MQIVTTDEDESKRSWIIHNDQNGHEYTFTVFKDNKCVTIISSSNPESVKKGNQAILFLDALMNSFASSFSKLEFMTELKRGKRIATGMLGE